MKETLEVFFSYAHVDEEWKNQLEKHLSLLRRERLISGWHDRKIVAGRERASEIDTHLTSADIILLLVSPDFIASDYCWGIEVKRAMRRHNAGEARVIPIIVRPVDWKKAPFGKLQALPTDGKPVTSWLNTDEAFLNVVQGIRDAIKDLKKKVIDLPNTTKPVIRKKKPAPPQVWKMPYRRNPFFTGREDILDSIHTMLIASSAAALSQPPAISGLGGIGKTQVAVEFAYRYRDNYQFVLWIQANTYETLISDFMATARYLNLPGKNARDQNSVVNAVKKWLEENTQWLLILDNADDLQMVHDFLPTGNKGHILLTTRANATGDIARRVEIEKMEREEGALFLLRRAKIIAADAPLSSASEADRSIAKTISEEMDGLPLALDQAGGYIEDTACGLSGYLHIYKTQRDELLKQRGGVIPSHPESVTATFSLALEKVQQVSTTAAKLLKLCAFLAPDAIPEEFILEGPIGLDEDLRSLVGNPHRLDGVVKVLLIFSLIRRDAKTHTLTLHRLVQAVLKDQMDEEAYRQWAKLSVQVVSWSFPEPKFAAWPQCQRYLPHALACVAYIKQWDMAFPEAIRLLNRTGDYLVARIQYREAEPLLEQARMTSEHALGPEHVDTATSLNSLAGLYERQGKYEQAEPLFQRALAIREKMLGPEHADTAASLDELAGLYWWQGKYEQAEPLFQRALAICEKTLGAEHPDTATTLNDLANLYESQGKYEQAEPLFQRALAIREHALEPEHFDTAISIRNLADLYMRQGKYEQAEPLSQRALAIKERVLVPQHPSIAISLDDLAHSYMSQGKYEQAEPLFQRALAIREHALGPEHDETATSLNNLANLYESQDKYEQAEPLYRRALAISEHALGPEHDETATSLNSLAGLYERQGKYEQAEPLYQQALAIREKMLGAEHRDTAFNLYKLANLYYAQGKYEQAEPLYQRALTIDEIVYGPEHPEVATDLNALANLYYAQGKYEQAEPLYQQALAIHEKTLGAEHPDTATSLNNLANLYYAQGKYEQALSYYQQARQAKEQGNNPSSLVTTLQALADVLEELERDAEALQVYEQCIQQLQQLSVERNPSLKSKEIATIHLSRGGIYVRMKQYEQALEACQQALQLLKVEQDPDFYGVILHDIGDVYRLQGKYEQALSYYQQARQAKEQGNNPSSLVTTLQALADVLEELERDAEVPEVYEQCIQLLQELPAPGEPRRLATTLVVLGRHYLAQLQPEKALPHLEKAQTLVAEEGVLTPQEIAVILTLLETTYGILGRDEDVKQTQLALQVLLESSPSLTSTDMAFIHHEGGRIYERMKQYEQALEAYQQALQLLKVEQDPDFYGVILHDIGDVYQAQEQLEQALSYYQQARQTKEQGNNPSSLVTTLRALAEVLEELERDAEALQVYEQCVQLLQELPAPDENNT